MKSNEGAVRNFINKTIEFSAKRKAVLRKLIAFLKNEHVKYVSIKLTEN